MNAVLIALVLLFCLGLIIMIAPAIGMVSFFAMIYFFANGQMMYGIVALVVWGIAMTMSEETAFVSLRKW
jgi:hypothetical protein